jgi:hypothetical protein
VWKISSRRERGAAGLNAVGASERMIDERVSFDDKARIVVAGRCSNAVAEASKQLQQGGTPHATRATGASRHEESLVNLSSQ